jgi:hypothetical protein
MFCRKVLSEICSAVWAVAFWPRRAQQEASRTSHVLKSALTASTRRKVSTPAVRWLLGVRACCTCVLRTVFLRDFSRNSRACTFQRNFACQKTHNCCTQPHPVACGTPACSNGTSCWWPRALPRGCDGLGWTKNGQPVPQRDQTVLTTTTESAIPARATTTTSRCVPLQQCSRWAPRP